MQSTATKISISCFFLLQRWIADVPVYGQLEPTEPTVQETYHRDIRHGPHTVKFVFEDTAGNVSDFLVRVILTSPPRTRRIRSSAPSIIQRRRLSYSRVLDR